MMKHFNRATKDSARLGFCAGLLFGFSALADDTPPANQTPAVEPPVATEPAPVATPTETPAAAVTPTVTTNASPTNAPGQWLYVNPGVAAKTNTAPKWKQVKKTVQTKVLVVNRAENSFTIEHDGKMHRLKCNYGTYIFRKGRVTTLDWLVAGTSVTLDLIEWSPGRYDLLTATILPAKVEAQPAGLAKSEKKLQREQA